MVLVRGWLLHLITYSLSSHVNPAVKCWEPHANYCQYLALFQQLCMKCQEPGCLRAVFLNASLFPICPYGVERYDEQSLLCRKPLHLPLLILSPCCTGSLLSYLLSSH